MTRLYSVLSYPLIYCQLHIKNKTEYVRKNILCMLCIFLIGFLIGNLFGTILKLFQNWEVLAKAWDGFIILGLITKIEVISYFSYKSNTNLMRSLTHAPFCSVGFTKVKLGTSVVEYAQAKLRAQQSVDGLQTEGLYAKQRFVRANGVRKYAMQQKLALQNNRYKFDRVFWTNLNLFKIGIMVGFFVDAFKVGS